MLSSRKVKVSVCRNRQHSSVQSDALIAKKGFSKPKIYESKSISLKKPTAQRHKTLIIIYL